jgi:hypothetical protein
VPARLAASDDQTAVNTLMQDYLRLPAPAPAEPAQ